MKQIDATQEHLETSQVKSVKKKNPHAGHRSRMRERIRSTELDSFAPHEILEYVLYHTIPRCNTNEIAHSLIETFGSLNGVLDASYDELTRVEHISDVSATFITFLPKLFRQYSMGKEDTRKPFDSIGKLNNYCRSLFIGSTVEQFYLLLFDNSMNILDCALISHGTINGVPVETRRITERALNKHASFAVITHNHPGGTTSPSEEDLQTTSVIEEALNIFHVTLLEHILVADSKCRPLLYDMRRLNRRSIPSALEESGFLKTFYKLEGTDAVSPSVFL